MKEVHSQIESFLRSADRKLVEFGKIKNLEDRKTQTIEIVTTCLQVLDYTANNFPFISSKGKTSLYFPRPYLDESSSDFFKRVRRDFKGTGMDDFLKYIDESYKIICSHKKCISHIDSKVKHATPPDLQGFYQDHDVSFQIIADANTFLPIAIDDSGINIGGFIKGEKGSQIKIQNSVMRIGDKSFIINDLDYGPVNVQGNRIVVKNGTTLELEDWLQECVDSCREISQIFVKYA